MLTVEKYLEKVLELAEPLGSEQTPIGEGFGRVLAQDVVAKYPVPPFSNSAMDGFAVRSADLVEELTRLEVVGDIPAGQPDLPHVGPGQAARIMTGAPMPPGADCVVQVEQSDQQPGDVPLSKYVVVQQVPAGKNVRHRGEDVEAGQVVLTRGEVWSPAAAAAAASVGHSEVALAKKPRVAVLATGSELVAAGQPLADGQIPDSNSVLLAGLAEQFGAEVVLVETVTDDGPAFEAALQACVEAGADVVVSTGAVSEGAFEVVRQTLEAEGSGDTKYDVEFVKVAMQPGKPQACGTLNLGGKRVAFLGLPGNPVSVFVSSWMLLQPLLAAFRGANARPNALRLKTMEGWKTPPSRRQFIPVIVEDNRVRKAHKLGSGSHLIASLHLANALAIIPEDIDVVSPGDEVEVVGVRSGF